MLLSKFKQLIKGKPKDTKIRIKLGEKFYNISDIVTDKKCLTDTTPSIVLHIDGTKITEDELTRIQKQFESIKNYGY